MTITAKMVQELRGRTGAGLMECKKALTETDGDVEQAVDNLRKAGLKGAEKRAGRETKEGRVRAFVSADGQVGAMVSLTSETDFVANTDDFMNLAQELAEHVAVKNPDTPESLLDNPLESRGTTGAPRSAPGARRRRVACEPSSPPTGRSARWSRSRPTSRRRRSTRSSRRWACTSPPCARWR
jgi:elongation factor Ts